MKKNKIVFICILLVLYLLILSMNSFAAKGSFSVSPTSKTLNVGESVTINIGVSNCEGKFTVKSSDSSIVAVNKSEAWGGQQGDTIVATAKKTGTATITITALDVADTDLNEVTGSKKVTITVNQPQTTTPDQPKQPTPQEPNQPTQKGELTSLKVNGAKASINGSITVEAKSSVSISAVTNTAEHCVVTDAYGTKYTIYSGNSKDIKLKNGTQKISIKLKSGKEYSLTIINKEKIGETKPNVIDKVDEEKEEDKQDKIALKSLKIENCTLTPEFSPEVYSYKIELNEEQIDITKLDIKAVANKEDAKIEIIGNEDLQIGSNTITIIVKSANGEETVTYQIEVNKVEKQEEALLTNADIQIPKQEQERQPWGWGPKQKVLITILTSIIAIFGIVYAVIEYRYTKNNQGEIEIPYSDIGFLGVDFKQSETDITRQEEKKEEEKITSSILNGIEPEQTNSFEETKPRSKNRGKHF